MPGSASSTDDDGGTSAVQFIDGELVLSPTDLTRHQECTHLTALDLAVAEGRLLAPPAAASDELQLIFERGIAHERSYLATLEAEGRTIAVIETEFTGDGRRRAEAATLEAMRAGVDVVYQATFFDGRWGGQADFLLKVPGESGLGPWAYDIADTKLARRMKVAALLQMATYAERLTELQGCPPQKVSIVTGDGVERPWRLVDVAAYARRARERMQRFVDQPVHTEPVPIAHCAQCRWAGDCDAEWRRNDDLSLVAFMRRDQRDQLGAVGIATLEQLAEATPDQLRASGIGSVARTRLREQAHQQLQERLTGAPSRTLLPPSIGMGLLRLPPPSDGDLYLDFEGDPYFEDGESLEYLAGLGDRRGGFTALWAHSRDEEERMVADLIDRLVDAWGRDPGMHVYHYAPYETAALKRLTGRYGVREAELDQLLRAERFVDLYPVVRQSMRISKESYSIKKVEEFYGRHHDGAVADAMSSVVAYERWIVQQEQVILDAIEAYNRDDVDSTRELHAWLEPQRAELEARYGPQPRPEPAKHTTPTPSTPEEAAELALVERLLAAGHHLLGDLVQWHRREARPAWWEVFRLDELEEDELIDDAAALGGLSEPVQVGVEKRSKLYEYRFPTQDTKLRVGEGALDVDSHSSAGEVFELGAVVGRIVLKRQGEAVRCRGLGPGGPYNTKVMREAIAATADDVLAGRPCLGQSLLERRTPPGTERRAGESASDAVVRLGLALDGEVLAVQGPPGSGKTTAGARLIRALLDAGKKVGVTANSHAVIGHLLTSVGRPALQKCEEGKHCGAPGVEWSDSNDDVEGRLRSGDVRLVGGTAWFWSRPDLADSVDVLVVDEAGQFSLANAVAVARAARSLVLLGDPQQLAQPTQAVHPGKSGVSVLEHMLDGADTIADDCGVFLDRTYRMHPRITQFVSDLAYDGRLDSAEGLERIEVLPGGSVAGSGLVLYPVEHSQAATDSCAQEADAVSDIWRSLHGVGWIDCEGVQRPLGGDDVLIVAPYNNQAALIRDRLPGVRVGTVDKFQGQEAPVVVYSMTSTSADDAPRGVSFLYDLHRLNVAVSRAKALAVVVLSPQLLDAAVRTPDELQRVNALCRLAELAATGPARTSSRSSARSL